MPKVVIRGVVPITLSGLPKRPQTSKTIRPLESPLLSKLTKGEGRLLLSFISFRPPRSLGVDRNPSFHPGATGWL